MSPILLLAGVALLALVALAWRFLRPGKKPAPKPIVSGRPTRRPRHYYGVVFRPGPTACRFANALREQRFLSEEAPRLPISGCDSSRCECLLIPTDDRRGSRDRRSRFSPLAGYEPDLQTPKAERQGDRRSEGKDPS